jgi:hypothetical protein
MNTLIASRTLYALVNSAFASVTKVGIDGSNKFVVQDAAGSTKFTTTAALTAATLYRCELQINTGTTTTDGTINMQLFAGDSTTAIQSYASGAAVNAGAGTTIIRTQLGNNDSVTIDVTFDDIKTVTGTMTAVGPVGNVAPTVLAGIDQSVSAGSLVTVTSAANDSDGTIATLVGAFTSVPSGTSTPTLTNVATYPTGIGTANAALQQTATLTDPGFYIWTSTATDDLGASGNDTLQIAVLGTASHPATVIDNPGAWTNVGGAADIPTALSDGSDSTYIESKDAPTTADYITVHIAELLDLGAVTFKIKARTLSGTRHVAAVLMQGTTTISTGPTSLLTTTFTDVPVSLTTGENAAITDRANLNIRLIPS